jgi:hypothetical protein
MKRSKLLIASLTLIAISQLSFGQGQSQVFKMVGINPEKKPLNQTFTSEDEILPFGEKNTKIYGLAISANVVLNSEESLVRLILVDKNNKEYLIYEAYPLIESAQKFSIDEICEETAVLNGIKANSIKIEITDAEITINSLTWANAFEPGIKIDKIKREKRQGQNEEKIARINKSLKEKGQPWTAQPTKVSALTYAERKQLYGQSTFPAGFEFYSGGIISATTEQELKLAAASMHVDWDWRDMHQKNWISPDTDQSSFKIWLVIRHMNSRWRENPNEMITNTDTARK